MKTNRFLTLAFLTMIAAACGDSGSTQVVVFPPDAWDDAGCTCWDDAGETDEGDATVQDSSVGGDDSSPSSDSGPPQGGDSGADGEADSGHGGGHDAGTTPDSGDGGLQCSGGDAWWSCGHVYGCCVSECAEECHQKHPRPDCPAGNDCFKECQEKCKLAKDDCEEHEKDTCTE